MAEIPGCLGHLTPSEKLKLQQAWAHLIRLGASSASKSLLEGNTPGTPEDSKEFMRHLNPTTLGDFSKFLWRCICIEHPDALVLRFLRARKWDVEKGVAMLVSAVIWRQEARIEEDIVQQGEAVGLKESPSAEEKGFIDQYRTGKSFVRGVDREGRPVFTVKVRLHDPHKQPSKSLEMYILHTFESMRMLVQPSSDKACIIYDMTGFGLRNVDLHVVKFLTTVFEARYPETLGVVLIHNAPFVFWGVWRAMKGWMDPVVASKIHFTRTKADLERFITAENLSSDLGGEDEWEYKYIDPIPGENDRIGQVEERVRIQGERDRLASDFERLTFEWITCDPLSDSAKEKEALRDRVAGKLRENYWRLDPYLRARNYYHRVGVVDEDGRVDFQAAL
ncbi:unnamed protein product [Clonostachys rhizophaga]|uniref:CRAL-TRIO domain-containing protein n=1 Tax=Clonostachys rhizophaga TaxID=160324 RepID=A0A9N9YE53_9HYPO|nr:unnamed protein product [Clonostachys rhizophaga]